MGNSLPQIKTLPPPHHLTRYNKIFGWKLLSWNTWDLGSLGHGGWHDSTYSLSWNQTFTQIGTPSSVPSFFLYASYPLIHWGVPAWPPTPPKQSQMGCGTYPEEEFLSLSCRHNFNTNPGHRNLIVERKHTYTYRLTFWHIINTFLLLAGRNLWKNQVQQSKHSGNSIFKEHSNRTSTPNWLSVCENSPRGPRGQLPGARLLHLGKPDEERGVWIVNKCSQGFFAIGLLTESQDKMLQRPQRSCGEKIILISPKPKVRPGEVLWVAPND